MSLIFLISLPPPQMSFCKWQSKQKIVQFLYHVKNRTIYHYLLCINFLSSPCFTAALSTTQVRNTSMGSIVVFFTRPEVK